MDFDNLTSKDYREVEVCDHRGCIVKHFKGDYYIIIDVAEHSETGEKMVVYKAMYEDCKLYVRPMDIFIERCNNEQFIKYGQKYRFECVKLMSLKDKEEI
jgi:hypothetical protein